MPADVTGYVRASAGTNIADGQGGLAQLGAEAVGTVYPDQAYNDGTGALWFLVQFADGTSGYVQLGTVSFISQEEYINATATPVPQQTMPADATGYVRAASGTVLSNGRGQTIWISKEMVGALLGESYNDSDGSLWFLVEFEDGTQGYVQLGTVNFISQQEYADATATPSPAPTQTATAAPTQTATAVPQQTMPPQATGYVRAGAGTVLSNGRGQMIWISKEMVGVSLGGSYHDDDGSLWFLVQFEDGTQGYVQLYSVSFISESEYRSATATASPSPTATAVITAQPTIVPTATPYLQQSTGYKRVSISGATLLSWPNVGAPAIRLLNYGEAVYTVEQLYDGNGILLDYVHTDDGTWGYVANTSLVKMTQQEIYDYYRTAAPSPTVAPTYSVSGFSGYGMILTANGGTVNFRTAPSMTGSSVISRLNNRSLVRVLGEVQSGGYTWYQCESNGSSGYIRGDYINLLSIAEYTQVLASGSYTSNNATVKVTATANNVTQTTWTTPSANKQTSGITFVTIAPMTQRPSLSPSPTVTATATLRPTIATMNYVRVSAGTEVSNGQGATTTFEQDMLGQYQNQSYRDSEGTRWYLVKFKDDSTAYVKYEDMTFITQTEYESATAAPSLSPSPLATTPGPMATSTDFPTEESSGFSISGLIIALAVLLVVAAGGLYGYTVYNKSRRRQAKERERNAAAGKKPGAPGQPGDAARKPAPPANSAVRRPVPPAGPAGNAPARPGEAPQDRKLSPSGTAYHQQMEASRPGQRELHARQPGDGTPRPQTPPQRENPYARPVQEVKTNVPRASVDGKYVGDARVPQEEYRARRMPVAPPPTEVDETPVRRHKRSQSRAEEGGETDKKE